MLVPFSIYEHSTNIYYKTKTTKARQKRQKKVTKAHRILQDKTTKTKSQKHTTIHSTVEYSDSYSSLNSAVPKNKTKSKTIPLLIRYKRKLIIQ